MLSSVSVEVRRMNHRRLKMKKKKGTSSNTLACIHSTIIYRGPVIFLPLFTNGLALDLSSGSEAGENCEDLF